ncbi:T9SS type A sorting domain-containing protein [Flavobacterium sp. RHBU_24]|uniref:T9SS type A sorting domain-containing protein n=1 Tax=Flavobacterium sp. RHBU_24 TaxID=3391185 RepID=UPI0039851672
MNAKLLFTICLLMTSLSGFAQRFDWVTAAGYVNPGNGSYGTISLARDSQGNLYTMDYAIDIQQCQGQTATPYGYPGGGANAFLYKFDAEGTLIYMKAIGWSFNAINITIGENDNLYLLGANFNTALQINDNPLLVTPNRNYLLKISPEGNLIWHKEINVGNWYAESSPLLLYHNNHIYLQTAPYSISKLGIASGDIVTTLTVDNAAPYNAYDRIDFKNAGVLTNGELVFAGMSHADVTYGSTVLSQQQEVGTIPLLLLRTTEDLEVEWANFYPGIGFSGKRQQAMAIGNDDGIYLGVQVNSIISAGSTTVVNTSGVGTTNFTDAVLKINADGQAVWVKSLMTQTNVYAMLNDPDGSGVYTANSLEGAITLGNFSLTTSNGPSYIAKLDYTGTFTNAFTFGINTTRATTLVTDGAGTFYAGGNMYNSGSSLPVFSCVEREWAKGLYLGKLTMEPDTPVTPTIVANGNYLTATPEFEGSIQWLLNGEPIEGANGQEYLAPELGTYSVAYSYPDACSKTSATVEVTALSVENTGLTEGLFYPNPATNVIHFTREVAALKLYNTLGAEADIKYTATSADVAALQPGIYFIKGITTDGKPFTFKCIKK